MDPNYDPLKGLTLEDLSLPACIKLAHHLHDRLSVVLDASDPDTANINEALELVHEGLAAYAARRQ